MGEARGPHKHHAPAQAVRLGSKAGPVITRGSLHPPDKVRLRIMNITGDVPPAGRSLPAIQGISVGRPEVSTLTVTLGELASRGRVLPRWRVLSLNITKPNQLCLRALLSACRQDGVGRRLGTRRMRFMDGVCCGGEARPGETPHTPGPHPLPGTAEGSGGRSPHQIPQCRFPRARMCMRVCVCIYIHTHIHIHIL